jgi:hypothetical protein
VTWTESVLGKACAVLAGLLILWMIYKMMRRW